jgi:hypothetical protein
MTWELSLVFSGLYNVSIFITEVYKFMPNAIHWENPQPMRLHGGRLDLFTGRVLPEKNSSVLKCAL